ncbi:hypothetical protein [Streptomyces sp. NPDC000880]
MASLAVMPFLSAARAAPAWSWADPITALGIAGVAVKEGRDAWRGEARCTVPVRHGVPAGHSGVTQDQK